MRFRISHVATFLVFASMFWGCADNPEPEVPQAPVEETVAPTLSPTQQGAIDHAEQETGATGLGIDEEILQLCPAVRPPKFGYDSAKVKEEFRNTLVALADCMKEGGLKGRSLLMIGHADPRGEDDYNMALGGRRADSVRDAMQSLGVDRSRMDVSSRGELEATGTDEQGWAKDRRVDIKLKAN